MRTLEPTHTSISIQDLARHLGAEVDPTVSLDVTGVASLEHAAASELTFLANPSYTPKVRESNAGAILVAPDFDGDAPMPVLRVRDPYLAFAKALERFHPYRAPSPGCHPTAIVPDSATVSESAEVCAYVVLGENVVVGPGAVIFPHVVVYDDVHIGAGSVIHSHASVREGCRVGERVILQNGVVVGADGFGFAPRGDGTWHKIPQTGVVVLDDDVEIQAGACIDRATVGQTRVGRGSKIDNLVQVGHGSTVGEHSLLCGHVGLAGSTHVGNHVVLGGKVGVAGHCHIGDGAQIAASGNVSGDLEGGQAYGGTPAIPLRQALASYKIVQRLPALKRRIRAVEAALDELRKPD